MHRRLSGAVAPLFALLTGRFRGFPAPYRLTEGEGSSRLQILLHQFTSPLISILLIAAVVTRTIGEHIDTGIILAAVLLNAVTGYLQEFKAESSVRALKRLRVARVRVIRGGREKEILDRPSRPPAEGIMSRLLAERTALVGLVIATEVVWNYLTALRNGESLENARTVAVTTIVFFPFFQAWNSRSEQQSIFRMNPLGNPFLFFSLIAALLAQRAFVHTPPLQWLFRTVELTAGEWLRIVAVASLVGAGGGGGQMAPQAATEDAILNR